jgi:superfamily II DNA/RNA helicase
VQHMAHCAGETSVEKEGTLLHDPTSCPASSQVDIAIATPGRLAEHLQRGLFPSLQYLRFCVSAVCSDSGSVSQLCAVIVVLCLSCVQ